MNQAPNQEHPRPGRSHNGLIRFVAGPVLALAAFLLCVATALADSGNYRIEVLVFSHTDSVEPALEVAEIRSFHEFPTLDEPTIREAPAGLEVMSDMMQGAWRRLRGSATFRPLLFTAWEQSRVDYHPPVRIHDEEIIEERLIFPQRLAFVDLQAGDMFEDYRAPFHRLDGTVQLQRTRFLHLNIDLEYRQELLPRPLPAPRVSDEPVAGAGERSDSRVVSDIPAVSGAPLDAAFFNSVLTEAVPEPLPGPALVHILKQSRSVRTDQMQYFDTPYLGVLVRVTATSGAP